MQVTTKITVDMTRQNVGQRVNAVQGDGNTRLVEITLLSGGAPWTPPEGVEAAIAYMQPGGTKGLYNKLADGTAAISISGNVATVILAPQMLVVSGTVQASLVFNDAQLNRLTTFPFAVSVTSNPAAGAQKVEDYLRLQWLEDKLDEYLRKAADSGEFDGKPGDNGVTFTPSVSENGDLSWRNNGGLPNPQTVNIRGQQGDSTAATAAAHAAQTSAANAETNAADAATSAAAAQKAVGAMGTELSHIKDDLSDLAPAGAAVGQMFRVAAISEDGKYIMEPADMPSGEAAWKKLVDVTTEEDASKFTFAFEEVSELIVMISGIADAQRFNFYSSRITNFYHYAFLRASKESSNYLHIHKRIGGMRYMESGNVSDETPTKKASYVLIHSTSDGILAYSSEDTISNLNFDVSNLQSGAKIQIFGR